MRSRTAPAASAEDGQFGLALDVAPEEALPDRLFRLGLPPGTEVTLTRNRTVLVSLAPRTGLRLHAGYAWAPDEVLLAIIRFLKPRGVPRAERLAARRRFLAFPVDRHAPSRKRSRRERQVPPEHQHTVDRLLRLHQILNARHFTGLLATIPITISDRMRSRLGEFRADHDGRALEITLSSRHVRRDGWASATDTLLHEMVHQWQCESGLPLDHGASFRRKAREVGISPNARVALGYSPTPDLPGIIT